MAATSDKSASRFDEQKKDLESVLAHFYKGLASAERVFDLVRQAMEFVEDFDGASGPEKKAIVLSVVHDVLVKSKAVTAEEWEHGFKDMVDNIVEGIIYVSKGKSSLNKLRERVRRLFRSLKRKLKKLLA